jgi:hypothetical protein
MSQVAQSFVEICQYNIILFCYEIVESFLEKVTQNEKYSIVILQCKLRYGKSE